MKRQIDDRLDKERQKDRDREVVLRKGLCNLDFKSQLRAEMKNNEGDKSCLPQTGSF